MNVLKIGDRHLKMLKKVTFMLCIFPQLKKQRNEVMIHTTTWRKLKNIVEGKEARQKRPTTYVWFQSYEISEQANSRDKM